MMWTDILVKNIFRVENAEFSGGKFDFPWANEGEKDLWDCAVLVIYEK